MSFLLQYSEFLLKLSTLVLAILILAAGLFAIARKAKEQARLKLCINKLNTKYQEFADVLNAEILTKSAKKKITKEKKIKLKKQSKQANKHIFVLNFQGDIKGSAVCGLREEITAILQVATPQDEVVLKLESGGGMVSPYGLAASQLQRLKNKRIPLTISIDKIAASGGYLMACVADKILAAPFAIIGSIGVVAQLPNFHRFLKKRDIDFELLTAGEYKRTLTMFGENTEKAREKTKEDLEEIHRLFKQFIEANRKQVNITQVATGAHWLAKDALELKLVDELITSDDYLMNQACSNHADIYELKFLMKKSVADKLSEKLTHMTSHLDWFK
ncbi:non-proteolytic protein peptidase family S49 [Candidatus Rickettsiella viridis]|uniref:Non-proteolytic protein peptidase family S49 n=1 Tax=Candidatus Rickettsiella viridis TaxID=676208 RepID=A0A2Z5UVF5_9COXI|nr:protease SohB [Candidatus Rickettsiella viridis]BBB14940.1 non-proteolytic protein peptidase family S49 [Candidatus Rickettsiella viridis]